MIEITIKTLDSRNHVFSVENELTVKQLKEHIAEPVSVPAESQRLIYCGRVLVDEKKLSEYDVNGKVIHLVQRAPPSSSTDNSGNSGNDHRSSSRRPLRSVLNQNVRMDGGSGNAMYLGAMAFPADLMDAQGITMPQPRHGLSQSRLSVVRTMLRRGRNVLQNLENPNNQESPSDYNTNNIDRLAFVAQATALAASVIRSTSGSILQNPPPVISIEADAASGVPGDLPPIPEGPPEENRENAGPNEPAAEAQPTQAEEPQQSSRNGENGRNGRRYPGTTALAELISMVQDINRRLQPFLERYYQLMRDDPVLENPAEEQRLFNQVSELMHFMSHAYHAISDVMCDFSQPPPRLLRCRPVLIQHSAVLQTGIPFQLTLNSNSQSRGTGTSNGESNDSRTSNDQDNRGVADTNTEERRNAAASSGQNGQAGNAQTIENEEMSIPPQQQPPQPQPQPEPEPEPQPPPQLQQLPEQQQQRPDANQAASTPNIPQLAAGRLPGGGNFELFMDYGQGSITIDSLEATVVAAGAGGNTESENASANATSNNAASESTENRTSNSPSNSFQNFMIALANHMRTLDAATREERGNTTTSGGGSVGINIPFFSSPPQGHLNTSTQPTTSTQTRSTTRPHVHIAPTLQGMGMPGFFDPFLPCNSHHIRSVRRRTQAQSEQTESQQQQQQFQQQLQQQIQQHFQQQPQPQNATASSNTNQEPTATEAVGAGGAARTNRPFTPSSPSSGVDSNISPIAIFGDRQQGTPEGLRSDSGSRAVRWNPSDVTFLFQAHPVQIPVYRDITVIITRPLSQTPQSPHQLPTRVDDEPNSLLHYQSGEPVTFEELLRNSPDFNYTEGESIITDFFMLLARHFRVLDAPGINRLIMFNIRSVLVQFLTSRLLRNGQECRHITEAVNTINAELRTMLESISLHEVTMRDDVDFIATLCQLNYTTIPNLIRIILDEVDGRYLSGLIFLLNRYARRLASILLYCCHNGHEDFERLFLLFARRVIDGAPTLQNWVASRLARLLRSLSSTTDSAESVHHLLVYRMAEGPTTALLNQVPPSSAPIEPPLQPIVVVPATLPPPQPQPMQVQPMEVEETPPVPEQIADSLPDVILGAEQWHNHVPPDWVPIITRDRERQRRQAVQGPLSDAYLSGMPSKRRKVVNSNKPSTNLARVISESMSTAMGAAGVGTVDGLAETAGADPTIRSAYKEQVRSTVQATLRTRPDYKPEKYPNAAKLFGPE